MTKTYGVVVETIIHVVHAECDSAERQPDALADAFLSKKGIQSSQTHRTIVVVGCDALPSLQALAEAAAKERRKRKTR